MTVLFRMGMKLSVLMLINCGIAQFSCPFIWPGSQPETAAAASHGCHQNHPAPAPEHNKCCAASYSQQADVAGRYIAPKLIVDPENAAADLTATASTIKELLTHQTPFSSLRYSSPVLRV